MNDFQSFPKIDAHIHYNAPRSLLCHLGSEYGFRFLTINTEVPFFPPIEEQREIAVTMQSRHSSRLEFIATFETAGWGLKTWADQAWIEITEALSSGARGIKVWKNIGMELKDQEGKMVMIDHPKFDPVFEKLASEGIPVIGHLGEPRNCWLPVEKMTVLSDREYFSEHPEYHMHLHPEFPSYKDQIRARDRMLDKNPGLRFIGAHLASLEWSVDEVAKWLDRYPNCAVDLAERINHVQLQSVSHHKKVREFFETYQDRIIYGTDIIDDGEISEQELSKELVSRWEDHWKFFSTGEILESPEFSGQYKGLNLSSNILGKIYHDNAVSWFGL